MIEEIQTELVRYEDVTNRLITALEKSQTVGGNTVGNMTINAGGIGVLIVSVIASFMCGLCIMMAINQQHQQKQIDDLHDYLNVVYQYAPQLKPKDFK